MFNGGHRCPLNKGIDLSEGRGNAVVFDGTYKVRPYQLYDIRIFSSLGLDHRNRKIASSPGKHWDLAMTCKPPPASPILNIENGGGVLQLAGKDARLKEGRSIAVSLRQRRKNRVGMEYVLYG